MNSIDNITSLTTTYISDLIKSHVLPVIVIYVNTHDGPITVEKLEELLQLQITKTSYTTKTVSSNKCAWVFKRGKFNGTLCGKSTVEGSDYCNACSKRRTGIKENNAESNLMSTLSIDNLPKSGIKNPLISVTPFNVEKKLFRDDVTNYILKIEKLSDDKQDITLIGILDDGDEERINRLTNDEISKARYNGFLVDEEYDLSEL